MTPKELRQRSKTFAIAVIHMIEKLPKTMTAQVIGKQLVRSATSVGANYRAACRAKSHNDFIYKMTVVEEESDESIYWLELLHESGLITLDLVAPLIQEADELTAIFTASGRTAKQN